MPRALAIETSSRIGSIATVLDGQVLAEEAFPHGLQHAKEILSIIDRLTRAQNWTPRDIDELYISIGPGSFTGIRIAVTLAKTLAFATGAKIVAVPTVQVLAQNSPPDANHVLIVLDAKREHIYTALFDRSPVGWALPTNSSSKTAAHIDTLANALARAPRPIHLLGEGIPFHRQFIPDDPAIIITPEEFWRPRAGAVAQLGHDMARRAEFTAPEKLIPLYIRPPEAEEKWEQHHSPTPKAQG